MLVLMYTNKKTQHSITFFNDVQTSLYNEEEEQETLPDSQSKQIYFFLKLTKAEFWASPT